MRYRKHTIEAHYLPGSDFKLRRGVVIARKPRPQDIDYVRVTPDDGTTAFNCASFAEAKSCIRTRDNISKEI